MNKYNFTCHGCDTKESHDSEKNEVVAALEINWGKVFNTSNGLNIAYFCPECFSKAKKLAQALNEIVKLESFHFDDLLD